MRYAIIENDRVANIVLADPDFAAGKGWIECGDDVAIGHAYDGKAFAPVREKLDARKARLRIAVNAEKVRRQNDVTTTPTGVVQCDADSRSAINSAAVSAMIADKAGEPFTIDWTLADDSTATLDGPGMIALAKAVNAHTSACHARARAIKSAIASAVNHAALDAIVKAGW